MKKKSKKSNEEKVAEEYFPVNQSDLKQIIEKVMKKNSDLEDVKKLTEKLKGKKIDKPRISVEKSYNKLGREDLEFVETVGKSLKKKKVNKVRKKIKKKKTIKKSLSDYKPSKISLKKKWL
jgi:hypothetical protein